MVDCLPAWCIWSRSEHVDFREACLLLTIAFIAFTLIIDTYKSMENLGLNLRTGDDKQASGLRLKHRFLHSEAIFSRTLWTGHRHQLSCPLFADFAIVSGHAY